MNRIIIRRMQGLVKNAFSLLYIVVMEKGRDSVSMMEEKIVNKEGRCGRRTKRQETRKINSKGEP